MIDRLSMFMVLAREEHFGRAAEVLGITQPSLSSAIKALEEQLGVQLVRRGSRYQGLTPEGERVLDWARRIVGDARAMQAEMAASSVSLASARRRLSRQSALISRSIRPEAKGRRPRAM